MRTKILTLFLIVVLGMTVLVLTGCENKEGDGTYVADGSKGIVGAYEFQDITDSSGTMSAEEWKTVTGQDLILTIKSDGTATRTSTYMVDGEVKIDNTNFTYDDQYFYGTEEDGDKDVKHYSYVYADGIIKLTYLRSETNYVETYKQK